MSPRIPTQQRRRCGVATAHTGYRVATGTALSNAMSATPATGSPYGSKKTAPPGSCERERMPKSSVDDDIRVPAYQSNIKRQNNIGCASVLTGVRGRRVTYNLVDGKVLSSHVTAHAPDGFSKRKPRLEISNHGCSSIRCPRWDSNPHCTDFEAVSSTNWDTGAFAQLNYTNTEKMILQSP